MWTVVVMVARLGAGNLFHWINWRVWVVWDSRHKLVRLLVQFEDGVLGTADHAGVGLTPMPPMSVRNTIGGPDFTEVCQGRKDIEDLAG